MAVIIDIPIPDKCSNCPFCIYSADEKRCIGYCNTSDEDYYCKALDRFMEYDKVDDGLDILGKPSDCPLKSADEMIAEIGVCKTENEMRIAERDYKSRLWVSGIFSEVISIIHKYCDKESI